MSLNELMDDENVKDLINEKLASGESFELISLTTFERVTSDLLKQNGC